MSNYQVRIKKSAKSDLKKLKRSNLQANFEDIVDTLKYNPYEPTHSFEKLYPPQRQLYSRRINVKHRVVYTIDDQNKLVTIYSAWSHYRE